MMASLGNPLHTNNLQNAVQAQNSSSKYFGVSNSIEKHQYLFEKKYKYNKATKWTLPPVDELFKEFYQFDNLQQLKHDLNAVKSKLNDYVLEDWSVHTQKQDPSTEIPWKLKNVIQAEFVTVAWCKLFECLNEYKMVKDGKLNSLHLCEAPGAFIAALNHYLHSTFDEQVHWKWLSTTLNPYYEGNPLNNMIIDDRFMLYTLDRWLFHEDFSGNIIDRENIQHMAKECKNRLGEVHLITADGSIDCIETPDNQEELVSTLLFAELCAGLLILTKGGSFLIKMFTLFEASSVNLVFFLNCLFEEVNVFKPVTSKRGNSELYLICLNYQKPYNIKEYLDPMMDKLATRSIFPLFPKKYIPMDFYIQHEVCIRKFMFEQMQAIESNIYSYEFKSKWDNKKCHEIRSQVRQLFFERYKVRPIASEQKILQNPRSKIEYGVKTHIYRGSHNKRICIKNLSTEEQLFHLRKALNEIEKVFLWQYGDMACLVGSPENQLPLTVFRGKPLGELRSSLFANVEILFLRQKIVTLYNVDPVLQGKPYCTVGTAENPDLWSTKADSNPTKFEGEHQREFYSQILKKVIDIQPKIIRFKNVLFLTHYSISILRYLTANMFVTSRISGNGEITLEITEHTGETINNIQELYKTIIENSDVLCFVDIVHLHRNQFVKAICDYNNQLLISNIKAMLGAD